MRLGPYDSDDIDVRSSSGGGGGGMRRAGGIGCGTILIALVGALVFGLDPMQTIGMVESVQQQTAPASGNGSSDPAASGRARMGAANGPRRSPSAAPARPVFCG